jgi:hypothetical protein
VRPLRDPARPPSLTVPDAIVRAATRTQEQCRKARGARSERAADWLEQFEQLPRARGTAPMSEFIRAPDDRLWHELPRLFFVRPLAGSADPAGSWCATDSDPTLVGRVALWVRQHVPKAAHIELELIIERLFERQERPDCRALGAASRKFKLTRHRRRSKPARWWRTRCHFRCRSCS